MLKIISTTPKKEEHSKVKQKKRSGSVKQKGNSFETALETKISFDFQGTIEKLLDDLKEEEKNFLERQTAYELNRYRSLVQKILKTIIEQGIQTKKVKRLRRDRADYLIVDKINKKLSIIANEITGKSNRAFNLLKSIEEIRGLVFDLLY